MTPIKGQKLKLINDSQSLRIPIGAIVTYIDTYNNGTVYYRVNIGTEEKRDIWYIRKEDLANICPRLQ